MSESKYDLKDKNVNIYLKGGWQFIGKVEYVSSEKIVLTSADGYLVVYRENIVAAMILEDKKIKEEIEPILRAAYLEEDQDEDGPEPLAGLIQNNYYGSIIPEDMLEGEPEKYVTDFSISFTAPIPVVEEKVKRKINDTAKKA